MLVRDQKRSIVCKISRTGLRLSRPGIRSSDGVVFVQRALPTIVEHAEGRVAVLLYLRQHDTATDGVDGSGRNEYGVAFRNRAPLNQIGNRAVPDRAAQFMGRDAVLQSNRN